MPTRIILAALLAACTAAAQPQDSLTVLTVWPKGQLDAANQATAIVAAFSKPMVPIQQLPEGEGSGPLSLSPSVWGKYRWLGTSTLSFIPETPLEIATEYRVTIKAGTRSLDGSVLARDVIWTFTTQRPVLLGTRPGHGSRGIDIHTSLLLHFNQQTVPEKALPFIKMFEAKRNGPEVRFSLAYPTQEEMQKQSLYVTDSTVVLKLKPAATLKRNTKYIVLLKSGLPGARGKLGLEREASFSFETYAPLTFLHLVDPQDRNPKRALTFRFNNPVSVAELVRYISFNPHVDIPNSYTEWLWSAPDITLSLPFAPRTAYTCTISGAVQDVFGQKLGADAKAVFNTVGFDPAITMTTGHGILEAYGERKYPVRVVNVEALRVQALRLTAENLVRILTADTLSMRDVKLRARFDIDRVDRLKLPLDVETTVGVTLDDALGASHRGALLLQVSHAESDGRFGFSRADLQVTEMSITGKFSPENILLWVTTLRDAKPVANAAIQLRDDTNTLLWQGKTNGEGVALAPGWRAFDGVTKRGWGAPRLWAIALHGDDLAYTGSDWNQGIEPYRFNLVTDWDPQFEPMHGMLFTDRGIYRPGEEVQIKGIFRSRRADDWNVPQGLVLLRIRDPQSDQVFLDSLRLNEFGSLDVRFAVPPEGRLGYYTIEASVRTKREAEPYRYVATESFRVEAYRVSEFEVTARTSEKEYIVGDRLRCRFAARYLFGGELKREKARWRVRYEPTWFTPDGWESYAFGRSASWYDDAAGPGARLLFSKDTTLNAQGALDVDVPTQVGDIRATGSLIFEADVTSPSRQTISGRTTAILHAGEFYIGIRPAATFIARDSALKYSVVTVTPEGTPVRGKGLRCRVLKREWHSVRKASSRGGFEWQSEAVDSTLLTTDLTSESVPVVQSFTPKQSGLYLIEITGKDARGNEIVSDVHFYASGSDYVAWERSNDDRIELIADARSYKPGQNARIIVKNPYEEATALVSIEREGILRHWRTTLKGSAPEIVVPLDKRSLPNVYVSVILLHGRVTRTPGLEQEKDVGRPSFKIGYIALPVDPGTRHLTVEMNTEKTEYRPGDSVRVTVHVRMSERTPATSELTISVADRGVLNLIGYRLPDPFDTFYGPRPLAVLTTEGRAQIVQARSFGEKGEDEGGGGGVDLGGVETRGNFKSTAYWNAHLVTDDEGSATVLFKLPDNLTTFNVMCVAQTKSSEFGYGETRITVNKPLVLQPSLPRFARLGDRFEAGAVVYNFTKEKRTVRLQMSAEGIEFKGKDVIEILLEPGEGKEVRQPFHATRVGTATFSFRAAMGNETDGLTARIPIRVAPRKETVAEFQAVATSSDMKLVVPTNTLSGLGSIEFTAASTALVGLENSVEYLFTYPYGCVEQKCSAILPIILGREMVEAFGLPMLRGKDVRELVEKTVSELRRFQIWNGGFAYWPGSMHESPYATAYVMYVLAMARKQGYSVDDDMLRRGAQYLKDVLRWEERRPHYPYTENAWAVTKAFILYTLTQLGTPEPAYYEQYFKKLDRIPLEARAYLLKAVSASPRPGKMAQAITNNLFNNIKLNPTSAHFEEPAIRGLEWCWVSNVRTTALLLQALLESNAFTRERADLPAKIVRWLMEQQRAGRWSNTQENACVVHALATYYRRMETDEPKFRAEIQVAAQRILSRTFEGRSLNTERVQRPLEAFEGGKELPLRFVKEGSGVLYAGVRMSYYPRGAALPADEGIAITKTMEPLGATAGFSARTFPPGTLVRVTLRVITPQQRNFVVVEDPVPAGFQIINTSLQTESSELADVVSRQEGTQWWGSFNHRELHDDRVLLFADQLAAGVHTFTYLARAITPGTFEMPAAHVAMMYEPEVFGRTGSATVEVK